MGVILVHDCCEINAYIPLAANIRPAAPAMDATVEVTMSNDFDDVSASVSLKLTEDVGLKVVELVSAVEEEVDVGGMVVELVKPAAAVIKNSIKQNRINFGIF